MRPAAAQIIKPVCDVAKRDSKPELCKKRSSKKHPALYLRTNRCVGESVSEAVQLCVDANEARITVCC